MPDPILDVRNLRVRFGHFLAVAEAAFMVERGSFTTLAGASGSGKSLSALAVTGLAPGAVAGDVRYAGRGGRLTLSDLKEPELRKVRGREIAYIFQDPAASLNPVLRVGEQVAESFLAHGLGSAAEARKEALRLLEAVRLPDPERVFRAWPHELSGGMRQRATIAASLSADPSLLIADEPTTALDATTESEILKLIAELRRSRGLSVLFITHDLGLAREFSDSIYVMRTGRVIEHLKKEDGFKPREDYSRALLAASAMDSAPKTPIGGLDAS